MSRGWKFLRDNPDERKRVKKKWLHFQLEQLRLMAVDMLIAPNPIFFALDGRTPPPRTRYCIGSWTEKP